MLKRIKRNIKGNCILINIQVNIIEGNFLNNNKKKFLKVKIHLNSILNVYLLIQKNLFNINYLIKYGIRLNHFYLNQNYNKNNKIL